MPIPYVILGILAVALFAFAFSRVPRRPLVAAVMDMGASVSLADLAVFGWLRLYTYRPYIFTEMRQDSALGVGLADLTLVGLAVPSLLMLFPHHRLVTSVAFVALLFAIEEWFVGLGLFLHHGWSTWTSALLFLFRSALTVWWLETYDQQGYSPVFRWYVVISSVTYLWFLWVVTASGVLRLWNIRPGLVTDPFQDQILGVDLFHGLPFVVSGVACVMTPQVGRAWRLPAVTLAFALYLTVLDVIGLWQDRAPWNPLFSAVACGGMILAVMLLDDWMAAGTRRRVPAWSPPES